MTIDVITASAGTGKTTEVARRICQALREGSARPAGIIATTFSRKAAAELAEAVTGMLLGEGRADEARAISMASLGTVNSVCDRLVRRFAFELGLSPSVRVVPEHEQHSLLAASLADVIQEEPYATALRQCARRCSLDGFHRTWMADIEAVVQAARQNGIGARALQESADKSIESLQALLDPVEEADDAKLQRAVLWTIDALRPFHATKKITGEALGMLQRVARDLATDGVLWSDRAALAGLDAGAEHRDRLAELRLHAAGFMGHPRLRLDLDTYVRTVFRFASRGLESYETYKRGHRFIDFIDQEHLALRALEDPGCAARLAGELDLLVVDEFQDTSPLQLAIFMKLRRLARRTVWVGDLKQSIYGFRGADPALMERCATLLEGDRKVLTRSYRSRPALVDFVSRVFEPDFGADAFLCAERDDATAFASHPVPPPIGLWFLDAANKRDDKCAIAAGIAALLADPEKRVVDQATGRARTPRLGDVAVLCAHNDDVDDMAEALAAAGIPVSVGRRGLLSTIEGQLAEAALRVLLDPYDLLAAATLSWYVVDRSPARWLEYRLQGNDEPTLMALQAARPLAASASPREALDLALDTIDARAICRRMPEASQRLANLQALLALAAEYEETCSALSQPASGAGLLSHLGRLARTGGDTQARVNDAVHVLTCHASKGLEWPVVVLADLDRKPHLNPFELEVVSDGAGLDPEAPLRDRWIRFWVSPFGARSRDVPFVHRARASASGQAWASRVAAQDARLLYVAMTRARDHLVLAVRETRTGLAAGWLRGRVPLPFPCDGLFRAHGVTISPQRQHPARASDGAHLNVWFAQSGQPPAHPPARLQARSFPLADCDRDRLAALGAIEFEGVNDRLRKVDEPDALGQAVHAFLAADPGPVEVCEVRLALARRILAGFRQHDAVAADDVVAASDRLFHFVETRYPGALWHREVEVAFRHGDQEVHGVADLLLECPEGWVVIDHKTYPGPPYLWRAQAQIHLPQLEAYARAVETATGSRVIGRWLHFPLGGGMLQVVLD